MRTEAHRRWVQVPTSPTNFIIGGSSWLELKRPCGAECYSGESGHRGRDSEGEVVHR